MWEWGNVRSECFDRCNLMLRMNIWGMNMGMLMLGMLGSFDRCKYMNVCIIKFMYVFRCKMFLVLRIL